MVQPLWRAVWGYLKKLKMEMPYILAIPPLGIYPTNFEPIIPKNICTPMFTAAFLTIGKIWKQPTCPPIDEWIKQLWYNYTMEY